MPTRRNNQEQPADAIAMLKADHQRVKDLFAQYEATSNPETKAISGKDITVLESACSDEPLGMCSPSAFERSYHVHARLDACLPTVA